jgi:pimeloyl-ACP methyl ester carboxylesterase
MPLQRVGDVDLYYELVDYCEPWAHGRTPLLLIHGLGASHAMWLYQVPAFCGRFPVIAVDLRNHGASTKVYDDFTIADMATDLVRLLRVLGAESVHVLGLSLGGMVALQLALDHPASVRRLVLADTLGGAPAGMESIGKDALAFIENQPMAEIARTRITNAFSPKIDPHTRDYLIDQVAQNDKPAYVRSARAGFRFNALDRLGEIQKPTLVIVGEEDVTTPPMLSEVLASSIPNARLARIAGAGHISCIERPVEFNAVVREFLEEGC